jgi:hypothetical protein
MLFGSLSHPLLWQDEAETAMFGRRVLEYGYPKVHGPRNVVYQFGFDAAMGVKERCDAYIGTTWGQFYFATIGLALAGEGGDLYRKTLRLRLPFALAGASGVLMLLLALLPRSGRERGLAFASAPALDQRLRRPAPPPSRGALLPARHSSLTPSRGARPPLRVPARRLPPYAFLPRSSCSSSPHLLRRILRLPRSLRRRSAARPARAAQRLRWRALTLGRAAGRRPLLAAPALLFFRDLRRRAPSPDTWR